MKKPSLHQLSNGLKVLLYNSFNLTTNSILVLVKTGTDYEDKKNNGISHFLEHIFFKGTKNFPSPQALGFELDKIGAEYNAFTSYEYTGYYIKTLPEYFERGIYLMSDLLINPLFNEEEIEKEKNVILEEINFHKDNPIALIFDETLKTCYGDQPAGWSILGREEVIKKINSEKIKNYFKKHYSSKNSLIVIAGNFDKNKILKTLEKYFKNYNNYKVPKKKKFKKTTGFKSKVIYKKDLTQSHLVMLFRIPGLSFLKNKRYLVNVLVTILGAGMSSRLFKTIREELGLTYYIRANVDFYTDRGYMYIQSGSKVEKTTIAFQKILEEIKKLKSEKLNNEEFEKAIAILKNSLLSSLESSLNICYFMGLEYILNNKIADVDEILKEIKKISTKEVLQMALKYLRKENLVSGVLLPSYSKIKKEDLNLIDF